MALQNRETLRNYFRKGNLPTEQNFYDLIDSIINRVDDGMSKTVDEGLMLSPIGNSEKLISFYKSIEEKSPAWSIDINKGDANLHVKNRLGNSIVTIRQEGKIGINNSNPEDELDVDGIIAQKGRRGTAYQGKIPGDGQWHTIVDELNGCHAFEILAGIGKKKTGKYALISAQALSTFGKSRSRIRYTQAYYGMRSNRILLRWRGDTYNFRLEMRTKANYGEGFFLNYSISQLWHDPFMDNSLQQ
ncbi:hypothetical protein GCM10011506_35720 [Marivirga lumbricoides]|uniref:Adhesin n=1 Tax=Marivirga lumbricoides TaxID=1046115 RepID=A0ABQ1MYZ2_9BACT|nr:hypothetical protein GCM10011506_35720 [Marivirga lumbricoides]